MEGFQYPNPAESAQRSASITDVVAIRGGGVSLDDALNLAWLVKPEEVEGRRFVDINAQDARCRRYFQQNFSMVSHIKAPRDRKAEELMRALAKSADPNEPTPRQSKMPDRPKRELIDEIQQTIDVCLLYTSPSPRDS